MKELSDSSQNAASHAQQAGEEDKFVSMVTAMAEVDLPLGKFHPRSSLKIPVHEIRIPRFPVIDYHNHVDSMSPDDLLRIMDACGVEVLVNITMRTGQQALDRMESLHASAANRFSTIAWMDWSGIERDDFSAVSCERLERFVERGACGLKFWKDLGLSVRDGDSKLMKIDDERLAPIFEKAADLGIPVMFHTADPEAFFQPLDRYNERYEELKSHPDWGFHGCGVNRHDLFEQRNRVFRRHPRTKFVGAHLAESSEDLTYLSRLLDEHSNLLIDISARTSELGRQPYSARAFFLKHADRILFGTDLLPEPAMYRLYYRFLETDDEYFEYPSHASRQGRWNIYGLYLPDEVLRKVYYENAKTLLPRLFHNR